MAPAELGEARPRILLVDDDPVVRLVGAEALEDAGFAARTAEDGRQALDRLAREPADLVVLDVLMPGLDGFEVCRRIRAEADGDRLPVLVITGLEDLESVHEAYRAGATDFATKPLNWVVLCNRIRYMLRASEAAEAVRRGRARLAHAQRIAGLGSWDWHPATGRMEWSAELDRMLGRTADEGASADRLLERVLPEDRPAVGDLLRAAAEGRADSLTHGLVGPDGAACRVRHRVGPGIVGPGWVSGTVQDVTRETELLERLHRAEKLEALGTLAGGLAHDLNNLLVPILGFTSLVLRDLDEGDPRREDLATALTAAERAQELASRVLAFARGRPGKLRPVALGPLVHEALGLLQGAVPAGVRIAVEGDERVLVRGDEAQLHQAVSNLCRNALQAMEDGGGELSVRLERVELAGPELRDLPELQPGDHVRLTVRDTGCGMPADLAERVFEPFFTTRAAGEGTGLGLSVVHGVVRGHGGAVRVETRPGRGTAFHVLLPALSPPEFTAEPPRSDPAPARLLVVDDQEELLRFARVVLERAGHRVEAHGSARQALERLAADPDAFDLLLTDRVMPDMDGVELAEAARRLRPELPIVMFTGWCDEGSPAELGADRVLAKPLTDDDLVRAVEEALEGR